MEPVYNYHDVIVFQTLNKGDLVQEQGKPIVKVLEDLDGDFTWESLDGKSSACDSKIDFELVISKENIDLAIEFADWINKYRYRKYNIFDEKGNYLDYMWKEGVSSLEYCTTEQLFEQFIKEKYGN